jgi:aminoglycoside phosphotransferase family enzyme
MKMRCALCSLVCAGLLASVSFAQPPGGGRGGMMGGGGNLVALAKAKDVAADLKLSEDQVKKLDELDKKMNAKRASAREDNQGDQDGMRTAMQEIAKETEKGLGEVVSADQMKRLKELQLQASIKTGGLMAALGNPDVAKGLKLNEEQQEQLKGFGEDMRNTMREMFQGGGDQAEMRKKMTEYRASLDKKLAKLLTDDQTKALKAMQGEEFKGQFPTPQMGGRGKKGG